MFFEKRQIMVERVINNSLSIKSINFPASSFPASLQAINIKNERLNSKRVRLNVCINKNEG